MIYDPHLHQLILEQVPPNSIELDRTRPNLGMLYKYIIILLSCIATDMRNTFRNFFPALATKQHLQQHRHALFLPHIAGESEHSLRTRITSASATLRYLGTRQQLYQFMNINFASRWTIIEMPKDAFTIGHEPHGTPIGTANIMNGEGLYIYITNLTTQETQVISDFLDFNTPPDVGYKIFNTQETQ